MALEPVLVRRWPQPRANTATTTAPAATTAPASTMSTVQKIRGFDGPGWIRSLLLALTLIGGMRLELRNYVATEVDAAKTDIARRVSAEVTGEMLIALDQAKAELRAEIRNDRREDQAASDPRQKRRDNTLD